MSEKKPDAQLMDETYPEYLQRTGKLPAGAGARTISEAEWKALVTGFRRSVGLQERQVEDACTVVARVLVDQGASRATAGTPGTLPCGCREVNGAMKLCRAHYDSHSTPLKGTEEARLREALKKLEELRDAARQEYRQFVESDEFVGDDYDTQCTARLLGKMEAYNEYCGVVRELASPTVADSEEGR